jgi:protein-S-isoprenylcysteine O-methyltransferase Ste14
MPDTPTTNEQESSRNPLRLLMNVPVPWVFVLAYLAGASLEFERPLYPGIKDIARLGIVGVVLIATGAVVAGLALAIFHKARTTTVPGQKSAVLVTRGPYRFTRNPMYVGLSLAYLGEAAILKQMWPVLLLPLVVGYLNWIVIPVEESRLAEVFGAEYDKYRAAVRRWI